MRACDMEQTTKNIKVAFEIDDDMVTNDARDDTSNHSSTVLPQLCTRFKSIK